MRESQCRRVFWIAIVVTGCLGRLLLYGQTSTFQADAQDTATNTSSLQTGPYYALVIGNNNYRELPQLQTAVNDAKEVARLLHDQYGFKVNILLDADRNQILSALVEYRRTLPENSNLLIYYAGHGHHDRDADEAYWLPVDAQKDSNANWISADDITRDVRALASSHVLIIADSCYSGFLARDADAAINPTEKNAYLAKMLASKSRDLMSSGGDEPVADNGAPGHSVFAWAILKGLSQIAEDQFTADNLFYNFIQPGVGGRSRQLPQYSWIRDSGHEYGDFVFSRQVVAKSSSSGGELAKATGTATPVAAPNRAASTVNLLKPSAAGSTAKGQLSRSPSRAAWAVGEQGTILHTQDGGRTWQEQTSGTSVWLFSVAFVSPQTGWVVGHGGIILHTDDGGRSWGTQTSGIDGWLLSVAFATPQSGWAVGSDGTILHTDNGGSTWRKQTSSTTEWLDSVVFVTPRSGWAVGTHGAIVHTEDGGQTWTSQVSGSNEELTHVNFAAPQSGWVVGAKGTILHTEDGGSTWTITSSGTTARLEWVAFPTPQSGWIVGDAGTILHTADGGGTWTKQISPTTVELRSIAFATPQSGWTVGYGSSLQHTEDSGGTWTVQASGSNAKLEAVAFAPAQ